MTAIDWSARARNDIRDLQEYIAKDSTYYARRFVEKIFKAVEKLTDHPKIGRRVPEADRNDVRELIFQNYRIIYLTRPDSIYIVTVIHGSRDLSKQAAKPWEIG